MSAYKNLNFSMVKYLKGVAVQAGTRLGIAPPLYENLDAHAQMESLPRKDIIGMLGFAMQHSGKLLTVHLGVYVSTFDDPQLVRHVELMDSLTDAFKPENSIPVFEVSTPLVLAPASWMVVMPDGSIDPMGRENTRSIQIMTLRLSTGETIMRG